MPQEYIEMCPDGGSKGGKVIFEGTPRQLLDEKGSPSAHTCATDGSEICWVLRNIGGGFDEKRRSNYE